jgi:hypothetical protein
LIIEDESIVAMMIEDLIVEWLSASRPPGACAKAGRGAGA